MNIQEEVEGMCQEIFEPNTYSVEVSDNIVQIKFKEPGIWSMAFEVTSPILSSREEAKAQMKIAYERSVERKKSNLAKST